MDYNNYYEKLENEKKIEKELKRQQEELNLKRKAEIEFYRQQKIDLIKKKREEHEKNLLEEKIELYKRKGFAIEEIDKKKETLLMQYVDKVFDSEQIQRSLNILEGKLLRSREGCAFK